MLLRTLQSTHQFCLLTGPKDQSPNAYRKGESSTIYTADPFVDLIDHQSHKPFATW
jgi:hypothetical protein